MSNVQNTSHMVVSYSTVQALSLIIHAVLLIVEKKGNKNVFIKKKTKTNTYMICLRVGCESKLIISSLPLEG